MIHIKTQMHSTTLQLAVRGKPSAFDLNCDHDICVVASPGCLTFFHLAGLGSPRHVIHYEQPQQIRQLRYQKYGSLAALRGGVISLWDPSKSLRPLIGFVQSPGWITDLNWNPLNHNILATSSDSGEGVSLWDVRSPTYSTMQMSAGQVATSVEWCPSNSNLLAACADSQNVFIWDIRMASFNTLFDSSTGERNGTEVTTIPRSLAGGAICCCWSDGDDRQTGGLRTNEPQKSAATTLIVGRTNGSVEWWDTRSAPSASAINKTSNHGDCPLVETACSASLPPGSIDGSSIMLAVQMGGGVVISRRQGSIAMKGAAVGVPSNDSKRMIGAEGVLQSKASLPADILSNSSTRDGTNDIGSIVSTSDYRMDIILRGYPIGGLTHSGAVVPPEGETETSIYGTSPNFLLATCCEPILGMRWGNSGRLMPSAQGGLDLHMMTDSAALHIIKIPKETLDRCSSDGKGDGYSSRSTELVSGSINVVDAKPKYALKKSVVMASGPFDFQAQSQNPAGRHAATVGKSTVPFRSGSEGEGLHLANLGYENDTSKTEFWGLLQKEVLGLEEVLQRGQLEQLSISRVDQHARQVTLEVNKVRHAHKMI